MNWELTKTKHTLKLRGGCRPHFKLFIMSHKLLEELERQGSSHLQMGVNDVKCLFQPRQFYSSVKEWQRKRGGRGAGRKEKGKKPKIAEYKYNVGASIFSEESSRGHCQTKDTGLDGPQVSTSVLL